ncbi:MAG TPA: GNAT family N-acetyltransferase [Anaerolineae bacterium]|nr:GNAT family N-acetyltransferase [Anaerolineae bacterium]
MEIANKIQVRQAIFDDRSRITQLLQQARYRHYHVDWSLPVDWLGSAGFVVGEREVPSRREGETALTLAGCLAVVPDPVPVAWVRVAAVAYRERALPLIEEMLEKVVGPLREEGVSQIAWLAVEAWCNDVLRQLSFERISYLESYVKDNLEIPDVGGKDVKVRPATPADFPILVAMEARALDGPWRHSQVALEQAWSQILSFDVAEDDEGEIIGFQYSMQGQSGAGHLVRITVDPAWQGQGVGSALMRTALEGYQRHGLRHASLNTQADNVTSHRLYEKFGFYPGGYRLPIWGLNI